MSKNRISTMICRAFFWTGLFIAVANSYAMAEQKLSPATNPPMVEPGPTAIEFSSALSQASSVGQEWTYHKTPDNLHPDGNEQQFMWLMNRARTNPAAEGSWLANTGNALIESAIASWRVDLSLMQSEFNGYDPKPPAAFDVRLYQAARAHSLDLIARDAQDHNDQFIRIQDAGFHYTHARGNVFSKTQNALYGHAAFNIDWGDDGGDGSGMQPDRGHRLAIMSLDGDYTNVGMSVVASNVTFKVGPLVTTGDFCHADTGYANHFNRFLVGTVWQDGNGNNQYDPGEGMAGITVSPDGGTYHAVTANSGGYAIPMVSSGTYQVTFTGSGISSSVSRAALVGSDSVLLDLKYSPSSASEPQAVTMPASDIATVAANLNGMVYPNGNQTDYNFQYGTTTNYGATTATDSLSVDSTVAAIITGLAENTTYHFRLVATNGQGTSYGSDHAFKTASSSLPGVTASPPTNASSGGGGGGGCFIRALISGPVE